MRIFPPHTHIDGFHDPQLTLTLKPNKTTQWRTYRALPKGLIDKWGPLALPWLLTLVWCDASASVSLLNALDGSQPNLTQGAAGRSGNTGATGPSTHKGRPRNPPLSEPVSGTEGLLSVIDDRGSAHFWSWHVLALLYLVNIILIISLTSPAVECVGMCVCVCVCVRAHTGRGFSMPSAVQVCVMKSWVLFWKPSALRFSSPSSPLLLSFPLTHVCSHGTVHPRLLTA